MVSPSASPHPIDQAAALPPAPVDDADPNESSESKGLKGRISDLLDKASETPTRRILLGLALIIVGVALFIISHGMIAGFAHGAWAPLMIAPSMSKWSIIYEFSWFMGSLMAIGVASFGLLMICGSFGIRKKIEEEKKQIETVGIRKKIEEEKKQIETVQESSQEPREVAYSYQKPHNEEMASSIASSQNNEIQRGRSGQEQEVPPWLFPGVYAALNGYTGDSGRADDKHPAHDRNGHRKEEYKAGQRVAEERSQASINQMELGALRSSSQRSESQGSIQSQDMESHSPSISSHLRELPRKFRDWIHRVGRRRHSETRVSSSHLPISD